MLGHTWKRTRPACPQSWRRSAKMVPHPSRSDLQPMRSQPLWAQLLDIHATKIIFAKDKLHTRVIVCKALFSNSSYVSRTQECSNLARDDILLLHKTPTLDSFLLISSASFVESELYKSCQSSSEWAKGLHRNSTLTWVRVREMESVGQHLEQNSYCHCGT
jgi:hypothetical protein